MPQALASVYVHLVFSTKNRHPYFTDPDLRRQLHAYMRETSIRLECPPLALNGVADHVHIFARLGRSTSIADWTKELKRVSSIWAKPMVPGFAWQSGYGAFSHSHAEIGMVCEYIRRQEEHHRQVTFQEEFLELLRQHSIEWDERYIWD
ncbi:MAG: transposase [Fimbriimonas sp.]